ncbi:MAG: thiazole synthase [Clostridiales bacterium]|nr:thiazole synthase [Clostridiales bacterium]MBS5877634.1 thiazole synthase [Clostridiales bacterium]MDU0939479.1 thiazole synthase [Clostridiales bacterium]MDU1042011.1 thiazole synthase [Clostridiales bacterium]MDU3489942.1 thiazole synthase [Clostridiales bacterium]
MNVSSNDDLVISGIHLKSRLFLGTGKFGDDSLIPDCIKASGSELVTLAIRRVDFNAVGENITQYIPEDRILMPNTHGARNAEEAVRIARLGRAAGCGDWIKIEVVSDNKYLLPDNDETLKATEILVKEGFIVMPYMTPDLYAARRMRDAGASSVMPLGAPIGTNKGLRTRELVQIMCDELDIPVVVDAGIGKPSEAAECMEIGAAAVLVNTAIATAADPVLMAKAFGEAIRAGRNAYLAGPGAVNQYASASTPLTGFLH